MKDVENYQLLHGALNDKGLQLKHLPTGEYMDAIKLMKKLATHFTEAGEDVNTLITQYNKEHFDKVKKVNDKKEEERTEEDKKLLNTAPPVASDGRLLQGPKDFIDKVKKIQERKISGPLKLNFITKEDTFKAVVQDASPDNQVVLYTYLFSK